MPERRARAHWEGSVTEGKGSIAVESGAFDTPYSFGSRFESAKGTNPEELLGAAHAGCFTMALSLMLTQAGHPPARIDTTARVGITKTGEGFRIPRVALHTEAEVPGLGAAEFEKIAGAAKAGCPVSIALAGTEITLEAELAG